MTDDQGRPLDNLRSLDLDFDLHHDFLHYSYVGNVVDEALSRLRLDSHPLADELHLIVTDLVLTALSGYLQHYYDTDVFGCVVRIRVEEEKLTTVEVLSDCARAYFEGYVRVGASVGGMLDGPCAICLDDLSAGDEIGRTTRCGHCFHFDCIARWLCRHMSCPMCRTGVKRPTF
ncbi:hypothetical protein H6P81_021033 [Aristolochia fimbriata]|uniref:RING-type domain-containing protein n=1 Tax=Aristolochia fimbriata TaxID=158543 RepID=A0AAV7E0E0_ARIFI|nr:hypothetical protein H6P81_021033 [Aristolochia fimbriata]